MVHTPQGDGSDRPRPDASGFLSGVLDQHAELRDLLHSLRTATDARILGGLLERLRGLLESHFSFEEAAGLLKSPGARALDAAARLKNEHAEILVELRQLEDRLHSCVDQPIGDLQGEVSPLLDRLARHDEWETDLLASAHALDRGDRARPGSVDSGALEVNLRRTAVEVVIPAEQRPLLEITARRQGVQQSTRNLLREINHPYVGWSETLDELHRRAMSDLPYYVDDPRRAEAVAIFCALYDKAVEEATPDALRETAIRYETFYLEKVVRDSGDRFPLLAQVLEQALARLGDRLRRSPPLAAATSPRSARLVRALLETAPEGGEHVLKRALELHEAALRCTYERWLSLDDPATWWREAAHADATAELPEAVAEIAHARLQRCIGALDRSRAADRPAADAAAALLALPDDAQIARGYLQAASCVEASTEDPSQRRLQGIRWLVRVLSVEALTTVHERALAEIGRSFDELMGAANPADLVRFVRDIFEVLRRSGLLASRAALTLVAKLGAAALATGDSERAEPVIEEILRCDFPAPAFSGFSDDWQVRSDPTHLAAIRAYLAVIEANPALAHRLIAGLVVHLAIGGVLITDTDLFQKDVSRLLGSGIGPVYHTLKHLLKLLPVYFEEIGAEGELRDVSSRIDEIEGRRDPLCHFLRKQSHVESNPHLIGFVGAVARFWATGDPESLRTYVPAALCDRLSGTRAEYAGLRGVLSELVGDEDGAGLFDLAPAELERRMSTVRAGRPVDREKVVLLHALRRLLQKKYAIDHDDLLERLEAFRRVDEVEVRALERALDAGRDEQALGILLSILEQLKQIIVSDRATEPVEAIYRKRHIAVGIPSLYGRYREEKLESAGLTFRAESLANVLFERLLASPDLECPTRSTLRRVAGWLRLLLRAVRVDGCEGRGLAMGIAMLEQAVEAEGTSIEQYANVFQVLSRSVEQLIRIRLLDIYEDVLEPLLERMVERGVISGREGSAGREDILKLSERFLRDRIAQSLGLQQLDRLVGRMLHELAHVREQLEPAAIALLISYDAERASLVIDQRASPLDGAVYLGNKGSLIRRMAREGLPIPPGFILTTEVFRCHEASLASEKLRGAIEARVRNELRRLERVSRARLGDAQRPLLLAVRSSSAISMPGVLDTYLNVGINPQTAEGLATRSRSAWGAWDAYRRFLQFWGMAQGLARGLFDTLIRESKARAGVGKKALLTAAQMKELALRYRALVGDHGIALVDDPFEQLLACIDLVLRSWNSERARIYRRELHIADEWGTAVIVQSMVYGNLHGRSGTGVVLSSDLRGRPQDIRLYGDFVVQGQGDDVVSGLVETRPVGEDQRESEARGAGGSLQRDFPAIYQALHAHTRHLVRDLGMFHQEVEFTFESDDVAGLYILQTRDTIMSELASVRAFVPGPSLERSKLATGIGAGGAALSGRVAWTAEETEQLRRRFPSDPIILLRPDTVPDDIPLIMRVDGMVTCRGGATSHAAVAAQRIGRTCVVGCTALEVGEPEGHCTLGGQILATGDFVSIDGLDGSVYLGRHPSTTVRRQSLA